MLIKTANKDNEIKSLTNSSASTVSIAFDDVVGGGRFPKKVIKRTDSQIKYGYSNQFNFIDKILHYYELSFLEVACHLLFFFIHGKYGYMTNGVRAVVIDLPTICVFSFLTYIYWNTKSDHKSQI